jgi:hypothetical protein
MNKTDLAKRAVACKGWRWVPGMLCIWPNGNEWRVGQVSGVDGKNDLPNYPSNGWGDDYTDRTTGQPDLTDPATIGCLLYLVREAWSDSSLAACMSMDERTWQIDPTVSFRTGETEAEALVCALEAAL